MTDVTLLEKLQALPPEKRRQVVEYIDRLLRQQKEAAPSSSFYGLWSDLAIDVDAEAVEQARRDVWKRISEQDNP